MKECGKGRVVCCVPKSFSTSDFRVNFYHPSDQTRKNIMRAFSWRCWLGIYATCQRADFPPTYSALLTLQQDSSWKTDPNEKAGNISNKQTFFECKIEFATMTAAAYSNEGAPSTIQAEIDAVSFSVFGENQKRKGSPPTTTITSSPTTTTRTTKEWPNYIWPREYDELKNPFYGCKIREISRTWKRWKTVIFLLIICQSREAAGLRVRGDNSRAH